MMPSSLFFKATLYFWFLCWCYGISEALMCFTCWKLICNDDYEACYEMRHFPSANTRNREISRNWRTAPECPADGNDLRWSKSYIQNCSEGETSCGTYLIQVTAAISKNSINETEFPILVTPNYYQGSIIALGCIPASENLTDVDNSTSISLNAPPYHTVTRNDTPGQNPTEIHMAPHVIRNDKKQPGNTDRSSISSTTWPTMTSSTAKLDRNGNKSTVILTNKNTTAAKNQTIPNTHVSTTMSSRGDSRTISYYPWVAPPPQLPPSNPPYLAGHPPSSLSPNFRTLPEPLPAPQPFLGPGPDSVETIIPLLTFTWKSLHEEICKEPLTHFESRDGYGTTTRINITGKFYVCNSCSEDLCNVVIPSDADITTESPIDEYDNTIEGSSAGTIITFSYWHFLMATLVTMIGAL
ncbi:unnamed protein product [Allacma fusca]|uniref:Uncharacterized protein n=1 Tax=Allacma fusca TaxID=39272 RepID=A0A8J2JXV9_9HEXA|nr:unnamed protein product [Allacma fusca]